MRKILELLIVLVALNVTLSVAQTPFFQQYHPLKRNRPVEVYKVFQDDKGLIWLGTDQGLFRFDGVDYERFSETDSLPALAVTAVAQDSLGRIWMGHANGELSYLDNDRVIRFQTREGSAVERVSDIIFDSQGRLWFSTLNDGLYYFVNNRLYRVDQQEGLPDLFVYDLFEDSDGNIWAGTDGGIAICTLKDTQISIRVVDSKDGLPDIIIRKITALHGDSVIVATEDAGILAYNFKTHQFRSLDGQPWKYGSISDMAVKENQIWIATPRNGLVVYDRKRKHFKLFSEFDGQRLTSANTLLKDMEGNIWVGSRFGLIRTLGDAVEHLESLAPCTDINILALALDAQNRLWFSSREGLFVRTIDTNGVASVREVLQHTPFSNANVISLYADEDEYVWAGLYGKGLLRIDPKTGHVRHFDNELRNGNILSITGRDDVIWVATLGGSTVIRKEKGDFVFHNYSSDDGLSSDFIYQVFMDSRSRIWFATDGKGVTMLDDNGFHHYADGLASKVVYSFAEDSNGDIWVSAQDNGVYRFEEDGFVTVPELRLRDNTVQALVADKYGHLIAMHNFGIDVFDIERKQMRYWGEETGIRDKHPNLNAVATDRSGQFYIGTTEGIIKLSLDNDMAITIPKPVIDGVRVYGKDSDVRSGQRLKYSENNITMHYLGLWYQNAGSLNYSYKLEHYDLEWMETRDRDVTYSQLPPGDYVFKVKVSDTGDFSHSPTAELAFSISPPFWQTGTFYFFALGLFVISVFALIKFRERRLLEDKLILEARVEQRTKEIQLKTEEIQAQNEEILAQAEEIQGINENLEVIVQQRTAELEKKNKALEEYAFINAHKLRGPVASILGLLNLLAKCKPGDDTHVIRQHLHESANKLDDVVRSITKAIEKADNKYL